MTELLLMFLKTVKAIQYSEVWVNALVLNKSIS